MRIEVISTGRTFKTGISKVGFTLPNPPDGKHKKKRIAELALLVSKERGKGFKLQINKCSLISIWTYHS